MTLAPVLRRLGAAALVLSPLLFLLTRFTWPAGSDGTARLQTATAAAHPTAWYLSCLLEGLSGIACVIGAAVLALLVQGRGAVLARVALVFAAFNGVGFVANWSINSVLVAQAGRLPVASAAAAYSAVLHSGHIAPFVVLLVVGALWGVLLVLAAARQGWVPWWVLALYVVGLAGQFALDQATAVSAIPVAAQLVALALVARRMVEPARAMV